MMSVIKKDRFVYALIAIYCSIVLFGNVFRLGGSESAKTEYGLSTLLLLLVIFFSVRRLPGGLVSNKLFIVILSLLLWSYLSALFSVTSVVQAYLVGAMLTAYLLASIAVYETNITLERARLLVYILTTSILVASILTIIDFIGIYNVPLVNENIASTKILGERVEQAGGFFSKRTSMAAYYSLVIPTLVYFGFKTRRKFTKLFMFATAIISYLALFFTHNRSGIVGILLALFIYLLFDKQSNIAGRIKLLLSGVILLVAFLFTAYLYFPDHFNVYLMKLNTYLPGIVAAPGIETESNYVRADYSRLYFFKTVLESLPSKPLGNGFSKIYSKEYGVSSPHNVISFVIWAAGLLAFIWLPLFVFRVRKDLSKTLYVPKSSSHEHEELLVLTGALQVGLFAWLLNNMAHVSVSTGLAWIYLGLLLNLIRRLRTQGYSNSEPDMDIQYNDASHSGLIAVRHTPLLRRKDEQPTASDAHRKQWKPG